ncbi:MAG: Uma2 family endonuclease [Anaerolineae bacterium CG03_land_8_20_14_0_80_58_20]|nr:MAG: hypothetical protein AUJ21_01805 [Anaerolineae bacterium CG1_02_58_13]PIV26746.1 MAG: Uma2 family endonuclease [Anaerolineae bacterium CG03_land_8_20_14_0_80_58_20]
MAVLNRLLTAEDLLRMPQESIRSDLTRGELIRMTPAGARHGQIAGNFLIKLGAYVAGKRMGRVFAAETGFILSRDPDTVRGPDVAFVSRERIPPEGVPEGFWPMAPDLAIEVVSPGDTAAEVETKACDYLDAGTRLVWVVNPKTQRVTEYRSLSDIRMLTVNDTLDGADVIPGFSLPLKELFE